MNCEGSVIAVEVQEECGLLAAKKLLHLEIILEHGSKLSSTGKFIRLYISWILCQCYSLLGSSLEEEIFSLEIRWFLMPCEICDKCELRQLLASLPYAPKHNNVKNTDN